jgi:acetyl esterase
MALDPIVKALLDAAAAMDAPSFDQLTPQQARDMYLLTRRVEQPEPVDRVEDINVPGPAGDIPARLYAPKSDGPQPALVYFHGGGFVIGDIESHDALCRMLANRARCAVVSIDYRLAPEHKFPAAADDCYAATAYIHQNAASFGIDPSRIAVGGDSAGGNLAAVTALIARDKAGPPLVLQLLIYPVTDYNFDTSSYSDNAQGYFLTQATMRWFWAHYLTGDADGANPHASPLRAASLAGLPPAHVITAEYDPLRDEGNAYAGRLRDAGVQVTHKLYNGQIHGFLHMNELIPTGRAAVDECAVILRGVFAKAPSPA